MAFRPLLALYLLLSPASAHAAGWTTLTLPDGARLTTRIMQTLQERQQGLMGRKSFPADRLMLFFYLEDGPHPLWMKNMRFSVDAAWIDADGRVVGVMRSLPPCAADPCPNYAPRAISRHFVEGTAGWIDRHRVTVGSRLIFGPDQTK